MSLSSVSRVGFTMVLLLAGVPAYAQTLAGGPVGEIAYLQLTGDYWQVWTMMADGSSPTQRTDTSVDKTHVDWRPGTHQLLYETMEREIFLLDLEAGETQRVLEDKEATFARWSDDGERLVFLVPSGASSSLAVRTARPDGSEAKSLCRDAHPLAAPVFASGSVVLHSVATPQPDRSRGFTFHLVDDASHEPVAGESELMKFGPDISRSGQIAYSSLRSGFYEIWAMELDGGTPHQVTALEAFAGNPRWSPDGSSIVFDVESDAGMQVARVSADGNDIAVLTDESVRARHPAWRR